MPRSSPRRNLRFAIVLLAELACTGNNPLFGVGTLDAADGPRTDGGTDGNLPEASGDAALPDAPADAALPDAPAPISDAPSGTLGAACATAGACQSGFCVDGVCCESACGETCRSCALPGTPGTCTLVPSGTECQAPTCSAGVEVSARRCNGTGACSVYTSTMCPTGQCAGERCSVGAGPVLYWRFDESSGATAATDSSPSGFTGVYRGESVLPMASLLVPPTGFANPRSLAFGPSGRPGIQLVTASPLLRPTSTLTVSLWYRATTAPLDGADLLNLGNDYLIRLKPADIEFAKRRSDLSGEIYHLASFRNATGHLDGNWHHLAGVITATAVDLYYDGSRRDTRASTDPILYRGGNELWCGRDGGGTLHDYQGNLDDVRIYARDLSALEIQQLATGGL